MKTKKPVNIPVSQPAATLDDAVQGGPDFARARAYATATKDNFAAALTRVTAIAPVDDAGVLAGKAIRR